MISSFSPAPAEHPSCFATKPEPEIFVSFPCEHCGKPVTVPLMTVMEIVAGIMEEAEAAGGETISIPAVDLLRLSQESLKNGGCSDAK